MKHNIPRLLALLLSLALLAGCGRNNRQNEIVVTPDDQLPPLEANYASEGYYAPSNMAEQQAPVAPAPAPATIDEIREAAQQRMTSADYQSASVFTNIEKGELNIGIVALDDMLISPLRCTYLDMMNLNTLVYEGLISLDTQRVPQPELADIWTQSGDTWEFTLRSNVFCHDGSLLSADDVVASYNDIMAHPGSYWYPMLNNYVGSVTAKAENTVTVKGRNGYSGYMLLYAMAFPVLQRGSIDYAKPVGTGPYMIVEYDAGSAVSLERNPHWWKRSAEQARRVVGLCYRTAADAIRGFEAGEVDTLASEYPTMAINRTLAGRITMDYSTNTYECLVPNLRVGILKDLAVRQALMYAIDRTTLANTVYTGMVQESEVPIQPGCSLYNPQAALYNYNPERAYQILLDAGWTDPDNDGILQNEVDGVLTNLELQLITCDRGTTSTRSEAAQAIATQLRKVGFDVSVATIRPRTNNRGEITRSAHSLMLDTLDEGKFQLALVGFELSDVPDLTFLLMSEGKSNFMRYKNQEMDDLLRAAYQARSEENLRSALFNIQIKVVSELPLLGLFFRTGVLSTSKPVYGLNNLKRGYVFNGLASGALNTSELPIP